MILLNLSDKIENVDRIKYCIAGSTAVVLFSKLLKFEQLKSSITNYKIGGAFTSNDTDIFFLGSKHNIENNVVMLILYILKKIMLNHYFLILI